MMQLAAFRIAFLVVSTFSVVTGRRLSLYHENRHPTFLMLSPSSVRVLSLQRGGGEDEYDEYDEYDFSDDEEDIRRPPPSRKRPVHPSKRRPLPTSSRRGQLPPRRRPPSALDTATNLAKKTASVTSAATLAALKGSGKAAFYLVSPKHVTRKEVWGVWRLDQQVDAEDATISCAANVEFTTRGDVLVKYKQETKITPYFFKQRSWPQSCKIEFEAQAFQGPNDPEPVLVRYKGFFRRKIADSRIIKIVGHIYEVPRKRRFGGRGQPRKIGSFVARRRMTKTSRSSSRGSSSRHTEDDEEEGYEDEEDDWSEDEEIDEYDETNDEEEDELEENSYDDE